MFNEPIFYTVSSADKESKSAAKITSPIIALTILLHEGNYLSISIWNATSEISDKGNQ